MADPRSQWLCLSVPSDAFTDVYMAATEDPYVVYKVNTDSPAKESNLRRNASWVWDWKQSPNSSRGASLHGGNAFGSPPSREASGHGGSLFGAGKEGSGHGGSLFGKSGSREGSQHNGNKMRRNVSFSGLGKEPPSREASAHGGNAFAAEEEEEVNHGGSKTPAIQPPKAMTKNHSIGSFMWDWGAQRVSPPSTPGSSLHGGSQFTQKPANAA